VAFTGDAGLAVTEANVLGILSLFIWSLILVVTLKYVLYVMRASNDGEGGIMALMALALRSVTSRRERRLIVVLGLVGVALFYGDSVITPAISVLSAMEGMTIVSPSVSRFVLPATLAILALLFFFERRGTERVGRLFGPIMILWFVTIGGLGIVAIASEPRVLRAFSPSYGAAFVADRPWTAFVALGAVVLCITGTEALYADMGHFGRQPIAAAWIGLVLPGLALSYLGQGALVLASPEKIDGVFFRMAPSSMTAALVVLSGVATVIASQAVISGAYSLTQQAIQLGYLPRMSIRHTSASIKGQIYVPAVNWVLFVLVVVAVLGFRKSTALGSAYGIAVTGTMIMTTAIAYLVTRYKWGWSRVKALAVTLPFITIDIAFFGANTLKIHHGGWVPIGFGMVIFFVMATWHDGRQAVADEIARTSRPLEPFIRELHEQAPVNRIPGTAVFLAASPDVVPRALLSNLAHNALLHERTLILTVAGVDVPRVPETERVVVEDLGDGFWRVVVRSGFLDDADVPLALTRAAASGLVVDPATASYFLGQDIVLPGGAGGLALWRQRLFAALHRSASSSIEFFHLPPDRVIQVGSQIAL
jgi:KUP system potassium uptake protein